MRQRIANQRVRKTMLCAIIALFTLLLPVALAPMAQAWVSPPEAPSVLGPYLDPEGEQEVVWPANYSYPYYYASHSDDLNDPPYRGLWYQIQWGDGYYTN